MDKLQKFAENFQKMLIQWKTAYQEIDFVPDVSENVFCPFIENIKTLKPTDLQYIVVGDNPGQTEKEQQLYFVGRTKYIRMFFESMLGKEWEKKVLFLNKTPIFTKETDDLNAKDKKAALEETQRGIAELILALHRDLKKCHLWIVGHSQFEKGIFVPFGDIINNASDEQKTRICLLKHPSYKGMAHDILNTIKVWKNYLSKKK